MCFDLHFSDDRLNIFFIYLSVIFILCFENYMFISLAHLLIRLLDLLLLSCFFSSLYSLDINHLSYIARKDFIPFCRPSLHLINSFLCYIVALWFHDVSFVNCGHFPSSDLSSIQSVSSIPWIVCLTFSSQSFRVSGLMLKFLIHLEFSFEEVKM